VRGRLAARAIVAAALPGVLLAAGAGGGDSARADISTMAPRAVVPVVGCDGCALAVEPGPPVNARATAEYCTPALECGEGAQVRITVTYAWPGGDSTTGFVPEYNAQTCIRWFAEPATLVQVQPGYAFGGDCSTNTSGTDDEFRFTAPGPVRFCAQVDAFIGSTDLGSSNLACLDLEPPGVG
jgi:hypothetical protein